MRFDLLIRGGDVVDPAGGNDGRLDVAVVDGRIAAVDAGIPADSARDVVDATGKLVTPGFVDLHTHVYRAVTYWGIDADSAASTSGVTTWVDAGSAGALTLGGLREFVAEPARVRILAFLNISTIGLVHESYEVANLEYLDVGLFERVAALNRDFVVGVKVRLGSPTSGRYTLEPLQLALHAAEATGLPLMVHIANGPPPLDDVLALMRPGDILTHCLTGLSMKVVEADGSLSEAARRAWEGGIVMDVGHGAGSFSFRTAEAVLAAGYAPHVISSDAHQLSVRGPMFDLPTCLSKFLALGLPLAEVVAAATSRPAAVLGRDDIGTLAPGAQADVAVLDVDEGGFPLYDVDGEAREARTLLRARYTIVGGRLLPRMPPPPAPPWIVPA